MDRWLGAALGSLAAMLLAIALIPFREDTSRPAVALLLVLPVLLGGTIGGRTGGATTAVVAALSFDFFHTRPYLSLTIDAREDVETAGALLLVGLVVGTMAIRGERARVGAESGKAEIRRIHRVAELVAAGTRAEDVIAATSEELTGLLRLVSCSFEAAPVGVPFARLERSGSIKGTSKRMTAEGFELPDAFEVSVMGGGRQLGRFVMRPQPGAGASLDERMVAVALADQAGAALVSQSRINPDALS